MAQSFSESSHTVKDFYLAIAKGQIDKHATINKSSIMTPGLASNEDVWFNGGALAVKVYLTAAETMDVVSDDTDDTSAGTGARTVQIYGLDANYEPINETVTMNGTTTVVTAKSYLRLNRGIVRTAGSSNINEGSISIAGTTSGNLQLFVSALHGQDLGSHFTIPADKVGIMTSLFVSATSIASGGANITLVLRPESAAEKVKLYTGLSDGETTSYNPQLKSPIIINEKTDIKFQKPGSSIGSFIQVGYSLVLVDKLEINLDTTHGET